MDKKEKLSLGRKKLKEFQSKKSSRSSVQGLGSVKSDVQTGATGAPGQDCQLQVHSQTIDILVSEKSELLTRLAATEAQLEASQRVCASLSEQLSAASRKMEEGEKEKGHLVVTLTEQNKLLAGNKDVGEELNTALIMARRDLEEKRQETAELVSKLNAQSIELERLQKAHQEMHSKLAMQELLVQQLQSSSPPHSPASSNSQPAPPLQEQFKLAEEEVKTLTGAVQAVSRERDQALSDVAALREAIMSNKQDEARKLGEARTKLAEAEIRLQSLTEELASTRSERSTPPSSDMMELLHSHQLAVSTLEQDKDMLQSHLHQLREENSRLIRLNKDQEEIMKGLEKEVCQLKGEVVDQQGLLSTITQDKAAVSRAVSQNKELKEQLAELQEAFVTQSHRSMELATVLETEQIRNQKLQQEKEKAEEHVDEIRLKLQERTVESAEGTTSLYHSRIEELTLECDSLRREKDQLLAELDRLHITPSSSPSPVDEEEQENLSPEQENHFPEEENLSPEQVRVLQQSFAALKQRFYDLMTEKVAMHDQLQEREHIIVQLAGETETIAEYVALYQTQREALKIRFQEKNRLIQQLAQEKAALELRLQEVLALVQQLSAARKEDHSPSLPAHLQPAGDHKVDQLVSLIEQQLEPSPLQPTLPCPCCSGQLVVV